MEELNVDQFRASADLPDRAKQYLDLLEDSGSSVASQQRHLLLIAANEASRHISTASKAALIISSPLDCLANVLAEVSTDVVMQGNTEHQSGKKLWGKLRSTLFATSAFGAVLKTQDDSSICSKKHLFQEVHAADFGECGV
jgi:hypothetical protein